MPRFFVNASQIGVRDDGKKTILIVKDDASHITRSLRMSQGDKLVVCDMARREYDCEIISVGESVLLLVTGERESKNEPPYKAVLYQALVKGDKFDSVVQKAVECGACEIVPVLCGRSIVRLTEEECLKKTARWQRIADEASKQCGRGRLVKVSRMMTFDAAAREAAKADVPLFCYEGESATTLRSALEGYGGVPETVSVVIGPEGGFTGEETEKAQSAGLTSVGLGSRILRTETASSFVLTCLSYEFEK